MSLIDQLGGLLNQYTSGQNIPREQARSDYDQIAQAVPQHELGAVIGPALSTLGPDQVRERIYNSATEMTPAVRGDFMQRLLGMLGGNGGSVSQILQQLGVHPNVAAQPQSATPDDVANVATHVQSTRPDLFNQAMSFYSAHPTLVKVLGTMAIAQIARQLARR